MPPLGLQLLVWLLLLVRPDGGAKAQAVVSFMMSETSNESGVCVSARGTVTVSDLRPGAEGTGDAGGEGGLGR
jgi:hypothetical protein